MSQEAAPYWLGNVRGLPGACRPPRTLPRADSEGGAEPKDERPLARVIQLRRPKKDGAES